MLKVLFGLQELLFTLIKALLYVLPIGILAFAGQLSAQIEAGVIVGALGKYTAVVIGGNLIQFFIVIPLFLLFRGLNPVDVFRKMSPAVAVALFTKSSAATLPVTLASAEDNLKAHPAVARFVLPICTTINMNGCAAFILVTSLFVMQNAGMELTMGTMVAWLFIAVLAAIGNAGVPMGCYFLTLSLMSSIGAPIGLLGIILPIYTIIDMIETAETYGLMHLYVPWLTMTFKVNWTTLVATICLNSKVLNSRGKRSARNTSLYSIKRLSCKGITFFIY